MSKILYWIVTKMQFPTPRHSQGACLACLGRLDAHFLVEARASSARIVEHLGLSRTTFSIFVMIFSSDIQLRWFKMRWKNNLMDYNSSRINIFPIRMFDIPKMSLNMILKIWSIIFLAGTWCVIIFWLYFIHLTSFLIQLTLSTLTTFEYLHCSSRTLNLLQLSPFSPFFSNSFSNNEFYLLNTIHNKLGNISSKELQNVII